ncbi:rRNA processing/ribosome biogenesis-domain-containing protein [Phaeosphaeria sp. MPI-PUGE-AT-0046c]|nr:rRNA processing/ribosome biogenesis-domain-containing protein [Phaeosphaeria sp. MPI-PUGE-AT-0046c]
MAPITSELATLRALTYRISSTPTAQLPQHVPAIAASLANCRSLLSSPQAAVTKSSSETSVAVHKYRTLLSTLLQDRTVQGRWSATVLIKATIEIGGWETLQKSLPWVRGLLGILTKPDPPSAKKLSIIALTRIFILTREYPTLVREITTPSLPAFIQSTLQMANANVPAALLQTILESYNELLPRHPTIFRSYLKQLHPLLAQMLAPTPSNGLGPKQQSGVKFNLTTGVVQAAQQLYVQTSHCAPKGASSEEWGKSLTLGITTAHRVADRVFRAVFEEWQPSDRGTVAIGQTLDDEVQDLESNDMALPGWLGLSAGSERLVHLLQLVQQFLVTSTANAITVNVSVVIDLVTRMLSLTMPGSSATANQTAIKINNQVSKDERENLWLVLPSIHVAAIEILLALFNRFQASTLPLDALIIDHLVWAFGAEKDFVQIRTACYHAIAALLRRSGVGLSKATTDSLVPLMRMCCDDLLPLDPNAASAKSTPSQTKTNGIASSQTSANADTFLNNSSKTLADPTSSLLGLREAAWNLLPVLLANVRAQYLSDTIRSRLDRTCILTQHKDAMVASVLNPPPSKKFGKPAASILPLMARSFPASTDVEGMLRPRMPAIRLGGHDTEMVDGESEDEEEEVDEAEDEVQDAEMQGTEETGPGAQAVVGNEDTSFMGDELDILLQSAAQNITANDFAMQDVSTTDTSATLTSAPVEQSTPARRETRSSALQTRSAEAAKRAQNERAPASPSKRQKTSDVPQTAPPAIRPATVASEATSAVPPQIAQTSDFTVTSTASAIPELPGPGEDAAAAANDSDEDDVVSLVLGQDSDDESE